MGSGGILEGAGTSSSGAAVSVSSGGILAPGTSASGNGTIGSLSVGSLTMSSGSIYNLAFNSTPANDTIVVSTSGGLTINGGSFNLYTAGGTTGWTPSGSTTYNLIQYSGSIGGSGLDSTWTTDSSSNPHVANPQAGFSYHFGSSGGYLTVTVTQAATLGSWDVDSGGNWSDATKWAGGAVPGANSGSAGDTATFASVTTSASWTVTLDASESVGALTMNQAPSFTIANAGNTLTLDNKGVGASLTVSAGTANAIQTAVALSDNTTATVSSGHSLAVSGIVTNAIGVTKTLTVNGAGMLALSGNNSYGPSAGTVGTTLSGGTLQVGNNNALGAGDVTNASSATLQAGAAVSLANNLGIGSGVTTTVDNNGNNLTLGGVIEGSGGVTAINSTSGGTTTLGGNNTYTGGTKINAGTVSVSADGATVGSAGNLGAVPLGNNV